MSYVLLENPYVLIPILAMLTYGCLVVWLRRRTVRAKQVLLVALLLCVGLPLLQWLVVTDREKLRAVCGSMVSAAEAGDIEGIGVHVARSFREGELDRDELLKAADRAFKRFDLRKAELKTVEAEVDGNRAIVKLGIYVQVQAGDWGPQQTPTSWTAHFELIGGKWQLVGLQPRRTPVFPVDRLEEIAR